MRAIDFRAPVCWSAVFRETGAELVDGKCFGWAASLAYCFFLALFPALLFVVSLAGVPSIDRLLDRMVATLSRIAPGDGVRIARHQFIQIALAAHGGVLTLSLSRGVRSTAPRGT